GDQRLGQNSGDYVSLGLSCVNIGALSKAQKLAKVSKNIAKAGRLVPAVAIASSSSRVVSKISRVSVEQAHRTEILHGMKHQGRVVEGNGQRPYSYADAASQKVGSASSRGMDGASSSTSATSSNISRQQPHTSRRVEALDLEGTR